MTRQFCPRCRMDTEHSERIKQKPSLYPKTRRGQFRAFLNGFFSGVGGHGIAALELLDRYVVCQQCGLERLENHGEEFK
ncbi:TPA: hypothetical protein ACSP3U_003264 [Aeromonas hydrophila]